MKKRVQVDSLILSSTIILTGALYLFPGLYSKNIWSDNIFDYLGFLALLLGVYLRMAARGYKKEFSRKGHGLVSNGLYAFVRNPMYLGSFLMGSGFLLIVWPWWALPIFALAFYRRFNKQMIKEEKHLETLFGDEYRNYCKKTPRLFPEIKKIKKLKFSEVFPWDITWSTKEKRGLFLWPLLGILLETFQQQVIFHQINVGQTIKIAVFAGIVFAISLKVLYRNNKNLK
ncbi:MAG: isoprenylcysteine carboxylmethyltransferase family protein [Candidatus Omnitrophica bacterium]|nr:isoprenylcysteine carboxylmethyltransferase family protein [Candidatus Omnitrophota bacterium]